MDYLSTTAEASENVTAFFNGATTLPEYTRGQRTVYAGVSLGVASLVGIVALACFHSRLTSEPLTYTQGGLAVTSLTSVGLYFYGGWVKSSVASGEQDRVYSEMSHYLWHNAVEKPDLQRLVIDPSWAKNETIGPFCTILSCITGTVVPVKGAKRQFDEKGDGIQTWCDKKSPWGTQRQYGREVTVTICRTTTWTSRAGCLYVKYPSGATDSEILKQNGVR